MANTPLGDSKPLIEITIPEDLNGLDMRVMVFLMIDKIKQLEKELEELKPDLS